jgi:RHS repeat-associated protein
MKTNISKIPKHSNTPNTVDNQIESLTRAFGTKDARITTYTYLPSGKVATKTLPDQVTLTYSYHPLGFTSRLDSSDGKIHHAFEYDKLGYLRSAVDENQNSAINREVDPFGNVRQEIFPNGLEVKKEYDAFNRQTLLKIAGQGEVLYRYDPLFLRQVTRFSPGGEVLFSHSYEEYDENGNLLSEQLIEDLGDVVHVTDLRGQKASIESPYSSQECKYDPVGNLITRIDDGIEHEYSYDDLSQLTSENRGVQSFLYVHDSLYNRKKKNDKNSQVNALNELVSLDNKCLHDLNGNQILKQTPSETFRFTYDPLNQLLEAVSDKQKVKFTYDPLGRRLTKAVYTATGYGWKETSYESYLYDGQNEIGAFTTSNTPKNLRTLGRALHKEHPATIALELEGQIFAPILDVQGNIVRLISPDSNTISQSYEFNAFGELLSDQQQQSYSEPTNPWRFASKRFDPELGLIYYGKRYYDPESARWLTTDPAGFIAIGYPFWYCSFLD